MNTSIPARSRSAAPVVTYTAELELFRDAANWKSYLSKQITPFLGRNVLEVGAGIGATTRALCQGQERWVCLEPDTKLVSHLESLRLEGELPSCCAVQAGSLESVSRGSSFDSVLYADVLEHIEDDRGELERACERLRPGGHLIVLAPAHNWLYTPFDSAVGHYRRYSAGMLARLRPSQSSRVCLRYLDSAGLLASLGNRLLLQAAHPTATQVNFWDRGLVRASRILDPLLGYRVGKSVLAIWRRQ